MGAGREHRDVRADGRALVRGHEDATPVDPERRDGHPGPDGGAAADDGVGQLVDEPRGVEEPLPVDAHPRHDAVRELGTRSVQLRTVEIVERHRHADGLHEGELAPEARGRPGIREPRDDRGLDVPDVDALARQRVVGRQALDEERQVGLERPTPVAGGAVGGEAQQEVPQPRVRPRGDAERSTGIEQPPQPLPQHVRRRQRAARAPATPTRRCPTRRRCRPRHGRPPSRGHRGPAGTTPSRARRLPPRRRPHCAA